MEVEPQTSERSRRFTAFFVGVGATLILGVAAWLSPSTDGIGTHQQLGLPQCGWIVAADLPCPLKRNPLACFSLSESRSWVFWPSLLHSQVAQNQHFGTNG